MTGGAHGEQHVVGPVEVGDAVLLDEAGGLAGFETRRDTTRPPPDRMARSDTKPKVPQNGSPRRAVAPASASRERPAASRWRTVVAWSWAASLGRPVVPEVVKATSRSSSAARSSVTEGAARSRGRSAGQMTCGRAGRFVRPAPDGRAVSSAPGSPVPPRPGPAVEARHGLPDDPRIVDAKEVVGGDQHLEAGPARAGGADLRSGTGC